METNTAAQRPPAATPVAPSPLLASHRSQPLRRETEYGCVDWFPYTSAREGRAEWFEPQDSGLTVGIA
jgi:hypothetical protein